MTMHSETLSDDRRQRAAGAPGALIAAALLAATLPAELPAQEEEPEATQEATYEVDRGDTLWDLAAEFLSDPFRWEEIYRLNDDRIDDPHWIFPGQRFLIPGRDGTVTEVTVREKGAGDGEDGGEPDREPDRGADRGEASFDAPSVFDRNPERRVTVGDVDLDRGEGTSLVSRSDFYRSSFVARWAEVRPRGTTARLISENPLGLEIPPSVRLRNRVVVHLGALDVDAGDTLQAVRPDRELDDVRIVRSLGLLEVRNVRGDSARAVVVAVYGDYQEGDVVIPAETFTLEEQRELRDGSPLRARVLGLAVDQALVSTGDQVFLDVGRGDGVSVGDEFSVFSSTVEDPSAVPPQDRLGTVRVVRVRPGTATARVVETRDVGIEAGLAALRVREPVTSGG
jgi:LysM repeat protein